MKLIYLLIPILLIFSCNTRKVEQKQKATQTSSNETCHLQIMLNKGVSAAKISSEYLEHGVVKLRPISRSRPQFMVDLACDPENLDKVYQLLEADTRILTVEKLKKKKSTATQTTNDPQKN